jgi:hypothetical protein
MATKFGKEYIKHPTPKFIIIIQIIIEYTFAGIATGSVIVPDEWTWWKYVVAVSGFLAGLMAKLKPYFGNVTEFPIDPNSN